MWNRKSKAGKVIDSNGGFFLKDKSLKAPDVAWIRKDRWDAQSHDEKNHFRTWLLILSWNCNLILTTSMT
ncbi:PDDEXK family nuclease [Spirosoma aureum]|uniref:hypothetical protein n=1 Tax=Spirosoma aureum TaxID=2692134 RepID=UPI003742F6E2